MVFWQVLWIVVLFSVIQRAFCQKPTAIHCSIEKGPEGPLNGLSSDREGQGSSHLEQACSAHATAHAHGDHHILDAAALAFDQRMTDQA